MAVYWLTTKHLSGLAIKGNAHIRPDFCYNIMPCIYLHINAGLSGWIEPNWPRRECPTVAQLPSLQLGHALKRHVRTGKRETLRHLLLRIRHHLPHLASPDDIQQPGSENVYKSRLIRLKLLLSPKSSICYAPCQMTMHFSKRMLVRAWTSMNAVLDRFKQIFRLEYRWKGKLPKPHSTQIFRHFTP